MATGILLLLLILILVFVATQDSHRTDKRPTQNIGPKMSEPANKTSVTAGGTAVPQKWQAKARQLGYYCPSWNALQEQASSGICYPLDK